MICIDISIAFFAFILLVSATPIEGSVSVVGIPISRKAGTFTAAELLTKEKLRIESFANRATGNQPLMNEDNSYVAAVLVGNQTFNLAVDTGSSITWVGAGTKYVPSSSSTRTNFSVNVHYGSASSFKGQEYNDTVALGCLTVTKQSIGVANSHKGFKGVDGILGLGPVDLTEKTVSGLRTVPTVLDNLYSQGSIATEVFGIYFAPWNRRDTDDANGKLTLGGADKSKYRGTLSFVPKSTISPYSQYWGVEVESIAYGSTRVSNLTLAVVSSGLKLIYIPNSTYHHFLSVANGEVDKHTGLARFIRKPTENFAIKLGSVSYPLTPAQYLVSKAEYKGLKLNPKYYYSWINNSEDGSNGPLVIIGQKFLENYYSVFDATNSRLGFAQAVPT